MIHHPMVVLRSPVKLVAHLVGTRVTNDIRQCNTDIDKTRIEAMPVRPTPQERQAAKKRSSEEAEADLQWAAQERQQLADAIARYTLLESVTQALYTEMTKMANKAPKETLTKLSLEKVNTAIRDVKAMIPNDENLNEIRMFEPAGDNPEYRDAVLILSLLRAALERFYDRHRTAINLRHF